MEKISIDINIEEESWLKYLPTAEAVIKAAAIAALYGSGIAASANNIEVSILLANNESIRKLNRDYRSKDKATNVLSFPLENFLAGQYDDVAGDIAIGDVIFALETIKSEALEQNKLPEQHLAHLAVHGTLHLIGYDHENEHDAQIMEALESDVLEGLGIANPYQEN
jgi:probable rRNA maturation factor